MQTIEKDYVHAGSRLTFHDSPRRSTPKENSIKSSKPLSQNSNPYSAKLLTSSERHEQR